MPLSPHVSRKLQETLGVEAGEELVTWMSNVDDLRGDVAELRHEMDRKFAALESRMEQRFAAVESRMEQRFVAQESRMDQGFARMETLMERRTSDLIKWSFVFWVGAVGAIAVLAGVLK